MAIVTTDNQHYADIASAIRGKNGESTQYLPSQMAAAITALATGGGELFTLKTGQIASGATVIETGLSTVEWFILYTSSRSTGSPRVKIAVMDKNGRTTLAYYNSSNLGSTMGDITGVFSISGGTLTWLKYNAWSIVESMKWIALGQE